MKWRFLSVAHLGVPACRSPDSYRLYDPTKPDPLAPPVLDHPVNGWQSYDYVYPLNVNFGWRAVPGAQFYQIEVSSGSLSGSRILCPRVCQTSVADSMLSCGLFYWRVRAASSDWNDYTDWSAPLHSSLPNPAR